MSDLADFVTDDMLAVPELAKLGIEAEEIPWDAEADWTTYRAVILRSTWDYHDRVEEFLATLDRIARQTVVLNSVEIVRWNYDKRYLAELERAELPIVPTLWFDSISQQADLEGALEKFRCDELITKPVVGAGAKDTFRWRVEQSPDSILEAFGRRRAMVQPFLKSIVETGEYSAFYFNGEFSHGIRKVPKSGDFRVQEEHGGDIQATELPAKVRALADRASARITGKPLYARVDIVMLGPDAPAIIELELIEPALYLRTDPGAPARFAHAISNRLGGTQ